MVLSVPSVDDPCLDVFVVWLVIFHDMSIVMTHVIVNQRANLTSAPLTKDLFHEQMFVEHILIVDELCSSNNVAIPFATIHAKDPSTSSIG